MSTDNTPESREAIKHNTLVRRLSSIYTRLDYNDICLASALMAINDARKCLQQERMVLNELLHDLDPTGTERNTSL